MGIRFSAAVDVEVDLAGVSGFRVLPDFVFRQGTGPIGSYTPAAGFTGTLTTADAADVPEPASLALLGFGLAGLAAARRSTGARAT